MKRRDFLKSALTLAALAPIALLAAKAEADSDKNSDLSSSKANTCDGSKNSVSQTVKTEEELKKAVEDKVNEIVIVDPKLIKKVHRLKLAENISIAALSVAIGLIVTALATAPLTGGLSFAVAVPIGAAAGLSASTVIAISALIVLGTVALTAIMNDYEEVDFSATPPRLMLRKKSKAKPQR